MSSTISAPGKMFLLGEYAVLEGAPALLTAVDRRVHLTVAKAQGPCWHIHAPAIGIDGQRLHADGSLPATLDAAMRDRLRVFDAVRATTAAAGARPEQPLALHVDSSALQDGTHKLGLGSSAAVAVALTAALLQASGQQPGRDRLCRLAMAAHRRAQQGGGSGADVATSIHGGIVSFADGTAQAAPDWPAELAVLAVMTGTGADTTELVQRVVEYGRREPARYRDQMGHLQTLAGEARQALTDGAAFLALADDYFEALRALDAGARAGIVLEQHLQLATLARHHGAVFKTTGAGGGDLGLLFTYRGRPARQLITALDEHGMRRIPLQIGASGLHGI